MQSACIPLLIISLLPHESETMSVLLCNITRKQCEVKIDVVGSHKRFITSKKCAILDHKTADL